MQDAHPNLSVADAECEIRRALAASPHTPVVVDFDETLWLRNSTEEYLRSLRPAWLAGLVLTALEIVRPWKMMRGARREHVYEDWIKVFLCTVLMPWNLLIWRRNARHNAENWANGRLVSILGETKPRQLYVATLGLDILVRPILRHIQPDAVLCAAGTLWSGHRIRRLGKAAWIERHQKHIALSDALVITDSRSDADLLGQCRSPVLVQWPDAEYRPARADAYVPFQYTQRAKRPGENYMLYGFFLEDVALLWLAFAWLMPSPLPGAVAILLLHLSFWAVYELGYVENDAGAARGEAKPKVYAEAARYVERVRPRPAWLAAALFGVGGTAVLVLSNGNALSTAALTTESGPLTAITFALWMSYLAASRLAFWIYNRLDVQSRGHFYVVLQLARLMGYALLLDINGVGAAILLSLALARWVKYLAYRASGKTFSEDQRFLGLMFLVIFLCGGIGVEGFGFVTLQAAVALAWTGAYAHRRARQIVREARWVPWAA